MLAIILFATEKLSVDVITLLPSEIVAWTKPWWALARHAAQESKRLGMEFGVFNGPGYETSDGPPELTMQEVCFSKATVAGGSRVPSRLR